MWCLFPKGCLYTSQWHFQAPIKECFSEPKLTNESVFHDVCIYVWRALSLVFHDVYMCPVGAYYGPLVITVGLKGFKIFTQALFSEQNIYTHVNLRSYKIGKIPSLVHFYSSYQLLQWQVYNNGLKLLISINKICIDICRGIK